MQQRLKPGELKERPRQQGVDGEGRPRRTRRSETKRELHDRG
jgi:hypothetical protein